MCHISINIFKKIAILSQNDKYTIGNHTGSPFASWDAQGMWAQILLKFSGPRRSLERGYLSWSLQSSRTVLRQLCAHGSAGAFRVGSRRYSTCGLPAHGTRRLSVYSTCRLSAFSTRMKIPEPIKSWQRGRDIEAKDIDLEDEGGGFLGQFYMVIDDMIFRVFFSAFYMNMGGFVGFVRRLDMISDDR